jgi:hypothetical protein
MGTMKRCIWEQKMEQIPRIYHMRCTDITSPSTPNGKWYCIKSRQCDVRNVHYFHYSKKFIVNSWILTYCEATRRWRKSFVVAMHPEKSAVMLVNLSIYLSTYLSVSIYLSITIYLNIYLSI